MSIFSNLKAGTIELKPADEQIATESLAGSQDEGQRDVSQSADDSVAVESLADSMLREVTQSDASQTRSNGTNDGEKDSNEQSAAAEQADAAPTQDTPVADATVMTEGAEQNASTQTDTQSVDVAALQAENAQLLEQIAALTQTQAPAATQEAEQTATQDSTQDATQDADQVVVQDASNSQSEPVQDATAQQDQQIEVSQAEQTEAVQEQTQQADTQVVGIAAQRRTPSAKSYSTIVQLDQTLRHDRRVADVHRKLGEHQMIANFEAVALKHNLSEPMVAAFRATPGFEQAVKNFPDATKFNIVAEHRTSLNSVMAMESFTESDTTTIDSIKDRTGAVAQAFQEVLAGLGSTVANLKSQLAEDTMALQQLDVADEVIASLPVNTMSHDAFTSMLGTLEEHLSSVGTFDVSDLRSNPERIGNEIRGIQSLVTNLGGVIGMSLGEYGLVDGDKDQTYLPSPGDFGSKSITKAGLIFYLGKADSILDALAAIADRSDGFSSAVMSEAGATPVALNSDDVTYGCVEHVTLLTCYTTMLTKLVRESIVMVSMLLSTVDSVLDIDMGVDD